jgi:hypothetical protein
LRKCFSALNPESFVFHFLSQNGKIKKCKIVILPVVVYGCEDDAHITGKTETESVSERK